jgi:hypothetical protein
MTGRIDLLIINRSETLKHSVYNFRLKYVSKLRAIPNMNMPERWPVPEHDFGGDPRETTMASSRM